MSPLRKSLLGTIAASLLAVTATARPTMAGGIEIIKGKMTPDGSYTSGIMMVKNNTAQKFQTIYVECAFFHGDELIDASPLGFINVLPGQTAYTKFAVKGAVDRSECRLVSAD
jgi:hypothetical protein